MKSYFNLRIIFLGYQMQQFRCLEYYHIITTMQWVGKSDSRNSTFNMYMVVLIMRFA